MDAFGERVAIVTGASSGIGAATARELARRGARVALAARRIGDLERHVEAINSAGGQAIGLPTDLTDREQIPRLVNDVEAILGPVDILVSSAGLSWSRPMSGTGPDDIVRLIETNLLGAMLMTHAVLPGMLERNRGAIVSIGSLSGRVAMEPVYSATKYGLRGFSLALRRQVAGSAVSVSLVSPGNIRTAMTEHVDGPLPGPQVVAEEVCELVVNPRREVVIPRRHYAIAWLEQAAPKLADVAHRKRRWAPVK